MRKIAKSIDLHLESDILIDKTVFQISRVYSPYRTADSAFRRHIQNMLSEKPASGF